MIKLVDILKEITEGKQVGLLYHFAYLDNIPNILKIGLRFSPDNTELPKYKNKFYISTTRDSIGRKFAKNEERETRITLNGDLISERYSIEPISVENIWAKNDSGEYFNSSKDPYYEERIWSSKEGYLDPKYIIKIDTIVPEDQIKREIEGNAKFKRFDDSIFKYVNFIKSFNNK
jgi:hypothetical protein